MRFGALSALFMALSCQIYPHQLASTAVAPACVPPHACPRTDPSRAPRRSVARIWTRKGQTGGETSVSGLDFRHLRGRGR